MPGRACTLLSTRFYLIELIHPHVFSCNLSFLLIFRSTLRSVTRRAFSHGFPRLLFLTCHYHFTLSITSHKFPISCSFSVRASHPPHLSNSSTRLGELLLPQAQPYGQRSPCHHIPCRRLSSSRHPSSSRGL